MTPGKSLPGQVRRGNSSQIRKPGRHVVHLKFEVVDEAKIPVKILAATRHGFREGEDSPQLQPSGGGLDLLPYDPSCGVIRVFSEQQMGSGEHPTALPEGVGS